jgi:hypothetical protein
VRLVPGIVDGAAGAVLRRAAGGRRVTATHLGRALGASAARVLGPGPARRAVARRHARGLAHARRRGHGRYGRTIRRNPSQVRVVGPQRRVTRPRPGFVRVVTPVRIPTRQGRPGRTVRVVSDVRVPRGAVPAGRPTSVTGRRAR